METRMERIPLPYGSKWKTDLPLKIRPLEIYFQTDHFSRPPYFRQLYINLQILSGNPLIVRC